MVKTGGRVLKIIGTAESGPAEGKIGGEPVILVGDTASIKGTKGDTGAQGEAGAAGADGKSVLSGVEAPTTEGAVGDFYIDTVTSTLYGPKGAEGWPAGVSLVGPDWTPTVGLVGAADIASGATGSIEVEAGVFIATYDAAA